MKIIFKLYILIFGLLCASLSTANDIDLASETMNQYINALKTYDTGVMTDLMHPDALTRFRSTINNALNGPKSKLALKELLPLFKASSAEEYYSLSDKEAYRNMNDVVAASAPYLVEMMADARIKVISLNRQNELIYIIYSLGLEVQGQEINKEVVQKMKLYEDQWMLLLSAESDATVARINERYK